MASPIESVCFASDGKTIALSGGDKTVRLWDVADGRELLVLNGHTNPPHSLAFSADGKRLLSCSYADGIFEWDLSSGRKTRSLGNEKGGKLLSMTLYENRLIAGGPNEAIEWNLGTGRVIRSISFPTTRYRVRVCAIADGIAMAREEESAALQHESSEPRLIDAIAHSISASPDGNQLLVRTKDGSVHLQNARTGGKIRTIHQELEGPWNTAAFSKDGKLIVTGDLTVRLWDAESGKEIQKLEGRYFVNGFASSPDGDTLAFWRDSILRFWDILMMGLPRSTPGSHTMYFSAMD